MDLIFEIGCEELPASFIEPALTQMHTQFLTACQNQRIDVGTIKTFATPRRLVLFVENLAETQADLAEERTGPPAQVAFKDGQPTKAAEGFARGQKVDLDDLYVVETDKGAYVAAKVFEKGQATQALLPEILLSILQSLHFPKSMRWESGRTTFARPIRWLMALADGQSVPFSFGGVSSGTRTRGHRFAAPGEFVVESPSAYFELLKGAHVVVDQQTRRKTIVQELERLSQEINGQIVPDEELVNEVTYLVEDPYALLLNFGEQYLELPEEVLVSSMRSHQRYFALRNPENGKLLPVCGIIYNTPVRDEQKVRDGNLRVLKARLDDARFFFDKDLQRPLADRLKDLENVVWLKKVGSMRDRSQRISRLAARIATALSLDSQTIETAARAGLLSKCDLVTQMVYEFPDLQGAIGREYALKTGESQAVATAIYEQYLPRGADDALPQSDAGACVALAERLDAIVGCFGIDLVPSSQSDPYGLRRAALGVLRILLDRQYRIDLNQLLKVGLAVYQEVSPGVIEKSEEALLAQLLEFSNTRFKYLLAADYPTDVVDAVLAARADDVLSISGRVEALAALHTQPDFEPLAAGFKRVVNILRKQEEESSAELTHDVQPDKLVETQEQALYKAYNDTSNRVDEALTKRNWTQACEALISLKAPVDEFFDHVMVMTDDLDLRTNRIALLSKLRDLFMCIADISHIHS